MSADLKLRETEENEAIVNTVRDLHRLVTTRHMPLVQSWIQVSPLTSERNHSFPNEKPVIDYLTIDV